MAFQRYGTMLIAAFYAAIVLIGWFTAMPFFERRASNGQTPVAAGNLHKHHVCGADMMPSTVSFVTAHGFKVAPSTQHDSCVPAVVTIIHISVIWFLVTSALGWGVVFLIRYCAMMADHAETRDEESVETLVHPFRGRASLVAPDHISTQVDEVVTLQAHHVGTTNSRNKIIS